MNEWTKEKPKKTGFYWIIQKDYDDPIIAEFFHPNSVIPFGYKARSADEVTLWSEEIKIPQPCPMDVRASQ